MRVLLNDIRDKLQTTGLFRYIDDDWGQLDDYASNPPTKWPCALVDVIDAKPESLGRGVQQLECVILVRLADIKTSHSSQQAPVGQRTKSAELFSIAQTVFAELHGWHKPGSAYGTLSRAGFRRSHRDDGIREYHLLFKTLVRDVVAAITTENMSESLKSGDINLNLTVSLDK